MVQADITKTVRYGIETVRGTGVACTAILDIADVDWDILPDTIRSDNLTGGVYQSSVVTAGVVIPRVKVKLGSVNPDKWQKWLAAGVDGSITSAGAGADKTWGSLAVKPPALSTGGALAESLKSFTLEFGHASPSTATPAYKTVGNVVERIKLVQPRVGFATAEIDFVSIGAVTDLTAYSGTLSPDAAPVWTPSHTALKVYVDDATIGTTQDTAAVAWEWEWKGFMAPDDNGKRLTIARTAELSAKYTRFHEAADMVAAARSKAEKKVRLDLVGPSLGAGTWILGADVYGIVDTRTLSAGNGFVMEEASITSFRDATVGSDVAFRLVNSVSAV